MRPSVMAALLLLAAAVPAHHPFAQEPATSAAVPSPTPPPTSTAAQTPTASGAQPARDANGTFTIRRTARLVVLDMVVTDGKGNVVTDLTRDRFHVTESGDPQTILNFDETGAHTPDPQLNINSTADLDRLAPRAPVNIILLDEFNTRFEDMAFARYSLKKYLDRQPGKLTTPTMLIAVDLQHFTVLRDYTQDKDQILSALEHHFVQYPWQVHQGQWISERYGIAFATLRRVAEAVLGHPGHKNMIWIGRGFPHVSAINTPVDTENRVFNAVQECVNVLRDARVTLYTIDPAGVMVDPGAYGGDAAFSDPFGGSYEFSRLARATGGKTLYGRNDVDAEIGTAIRDGASFYTLTYRPSGMSADPQKFRRIKVSIDRPGLVVTTREGYYQELGPGRVNPQNPSRRLIGDLVSADSSTMVYDAVPISLQASASDPDSFVVRVDGRGLIWSNGTDTEPRHTEVILLASSFDRKGKELQRHAKVIKANAPADVPQTGRLDRGLDIHYKLEHDAKAVRARFVVRVTASGRIGTADTALGQQAAATSAAPPPAAP